MPSSPHPYRAPAHQLQHPEHASYSPSPRSTPLYSSTARKSRAYPNTPDASSPESFNDHNRVKKAIHDHHSAAPSAVHVSAAPFESSYPPIGPSPPKRRKQSHSSPVLPDPSNSPSLKARKSASTEMRVADSAIDYKPSTRVAKACQPCSTKKRRCDGRQPECSVCQVLGTPCTYNHTGLKRGPPKGFRSGPKESARAKLIRSLETTIRDLVNHLGKEDAGAEIIRVSGERELQISQAQTVDEAIQYGIKSNNRPDSRVDTDGRPSSRIKIEHLTSSGRHISTSLNHAQNSDAEEDDPAAEAEEDVIGETRQGELVYRGSSSGIGILQRQHRAESPSAVMPANRSVGSSTSAPFARRSRDDRGLDDVASNPKAPVFLPISSPRPIGDTETTSSLDRSPRPNKLTPRRDAANFQSLYPGSSRDGQDSMNHTSTEDPLVSAEENDRLFRYYWHGFHPFYPILYKPWFVGFSGEELRTNLDPSLRFAIYAIGACVVPGTASATSAAAKPESALEQINLERAQSFCQAAERHVLARGMRPDIASIQTCWILSLYSHGTGDLSRAWNFQNLASSMAVDMGLHRWPIYRPEIVQDRVQRETRIRIIWHCYIIDKLLCAEMGRPVGLRAKDIDAPLLSETEDDEFELWSDQTEMQPVEQAGARPMSATSASARRLHAPSCLNWGVHLFKIVERILDEVHSLRRKALLRRQGKEQVLEDLDRQLTDWKEKLPPHLHLDDSTNEGPFPSFFALNLWYYTARLLLHRPFIPQEEGLPMSKVLENDSHRQSTLAANTICDLLEASSRDIVDRLSTDLGYCLFTAAVMFVFNARLPDTRIASDARRRYGLCMQWLKKLADTWPAASAHRMLLDGFAVVGEDASKQGANPQQRRPSIAALQTTNVGGGMAASSKVSSWIAETEGALQEKTASSHATGSGERSTVASRNPDSTPVCDHEPRQRGPNPQGVATRPSPLSGSVQNRTNDLQPFAENWSKDMNAFAADPTNNHMRNVGVANPVDFAPGIFDVESFFWNENAAAPQLMGMNFQPLPTNHVQAAVPGHDSLQHQNQQNVPYNSFNGGVVGDGFHMGTVQNTPSSLPFPAEMAYTQHARSNIVASGMGTSQAMQTAPIRAVSANVPGLPVSQSTAAQSTSATAAAQDPATVGTFNTSPFAFNPTNQSIGEFWNMLELPPAFLQQ